MQKVYKSNLSSPFSIKTMSPVLSFLASLSVVVIWILCLWVGPCKIPLARPPCLHVYWRCHGPDLVYAAILLRIRG